MKFIKSLVLVFIILITSTSIAFAQKTTQNTDSTKTVTIKVKGITCSMDLKMIAANVEKLKGVSSCKSGKMGTTSSFQITFNPAIVTEIEIHKTIENTGSCENPEEKIYKIKQ
ncbi:heavy-metal-associated domain-containing protein [Flavobacterium sp. LB2P53]|uniref:heavy-metal-associated domain-containing protein n=1 Tax=Flavobacterium sp. LB2P53 TaxID=2497481 RepID=UPI000F82A7E7|nr:heavy metal-associated domain-containing protein [Flavobacterium sp. LB2P53]RTY67096.1 heavy-metal-associated domain-containing protein [Flavobacterium sp. LB2P53]